MQEQQLIPFGQDDAPGHLCGMRAEHQINAVDRLWVEQSELAIPPVRRAACPAASEVFLGVRECIRDDFEAERGYAGYPALPARLQIRLDAGVAEKLVDIEDDHPICRAAALLPAIVEQHFLRTIERIRNRAWERPDFHVALRQQVFAAAVGRTVVETHETLDPRLIMPKKKSQHGHFIPKGRVQVNSHRCCPDDP